MKRIKKNFPLFLCGVTILFSACGPSYEFKSAQKAEAKGKYYLAWKKYQSFTAHYPAHALAAEALFRVGLLSQQKQGDCTMAVAFYDNLLEKYPQSDPWAKAALLQKNACPDYFPLMPGWKWVEGDSESRGGNARIEKEAIAIDKSVKSLPNESGRMKLTYFAGSTKFKTGESLFQKKNSELWEYPVASEPMARIALRWPLEAGVSWTYKLNSKLFHLEIVDVNATVSVMAGDFSRCIKVKSTVEGSSGSTFEYYAPGVGRVLTTLSSASGEKPNTELLSFTKGSDVVYESGMTTK